MLEVQLSHSFSAFTLDVQFSVPSGISVLFGRSGSGKSTVLKAVGGVLRPRAGHISLNERLLLDTDHKLFVPPHRRNIATIFQEGRLFPHMSVRQNLMYGRWVKGHPRDMREEKRIIELLGLGPYLKRRPGGLSGGEKQRVAIGRALLAQPKLILADEPLAALDEPRKAEILPYFERLRDEVQIPILYVTHAPAEVARLANHVVALDEGRVVGVGATQDILGDPHLMPAGVRAAGAVLEARVIAHHDDGLSELEAGGEVLFVPGVPYAADSLLRVRVAASDVILATEPPKALSALNVMRGQVRSVRSGTGPGAMIQIDTSAGLLLARITRRSAMALALSPGAPCYAILKAVSVGREDVGAGYADR